MPGPGSLRAAARRDGAREDAPSTRASSRSAASSAARRRTSTSSPRGRERPPARRARDRRARRVRRPHHGQASRRSSSVGRAPRPFAPRSRWPTLFAQLRRCQPLRLEPFGYTARPMSKVCAVCGKKPGFGNNRSHSMVATKRRFNPNLQRVRVLLEGQGDPRLRLHPLPQGRQGAKSSLSSNFIRRLMV